MATVEDVEARVWNAVVPDLPFDPSAAIRVSTGIRRSESAPSGSVAMKLAWMGLARRRSPMCSSGSEVSPRRRVRGRTADIGAADAAVRWASRRTVLRTSPAKVSRFAAHGPSGTSTGHEMLEGEP